jgi:hypothetical protein
MKDALWSHDKFVRAPTVRQFAQVEYFGFEGYFGYEGSVDTQFVEGRRNLLFSSFEWLMLSNTDSHFESKG